MGVCSEHIFRRVFDRWQIPLQHFLQARGLDMELAADEVQNCFLRLWNNCSKVQEEKAKSFLFTTAKRLQIDAYRKNQVRLKHVQQTNDSSVETQDAQFLLEEQEFKTKLEQVMDAMSPASKEVFILHRFDKLSYKEIAESIGIGVKAVEKRMSKALKHLLENKIQLPR